jgi:hypothetical protein
VGEHHILDWLVGNLTHPIDDQLRHHRRCLGIDDDHPVVADDDAAVGVTLGSEGVETAADLAEGDVLRSEVADGCKGLGHVRASPCQRHVPYRATRWSMAPKIEPLASSIAMRTRSPNL